MSLPKKAYQKYRQEGLLELIASSRRFFARRATSPVARALYNRSSHIRYQDIVNTAEHRRIIKLDPDTSEHSKADIPFSMEPQDENFRNLPRYAFNDQYVTEFNNVRLVGPDAIPITTDGDIIAEAIEPAPENGYRLNQALNRLLCDRTAIKSYLSGPKREMDCVCSLVTNWNNYYHWMIEHLPKLRAVEAVAQSWDVAPTLLIPADPPSYITESLKLMGYDASDWIEWHGGAVQVKTYIQPTFTEPTKKVCDWLQQRACANVNGAETVEANRIYVSRRKASTRNIVNEEAIEAVLQDFGFETYTTEDLKVPEQVGLFNNARAVVGVHGAGLTDMIWSENITVIELFNKFVKPPYYQISSNIGANYHTVRGESVGDSGYNSDVYISPRKLENVLENAPI